MQNIQENNLKKTSLSIFGCGWLGLALAEKLISKNSIVSGSTTTEDKFKNLANKGIKPVLVELNPSFLIDENHYFLQSEYLIICFPPKLRNNGNDFYIEQIKSLSDNLHKFNASKIIFTSSTSVYQNLNKEMTEADADKSNVLYKAEELLKEAVLLNHKEINILRLSGLMGYDRIPCKYFAGQKGLENGENPVNYIYRDDVIGIIEALIENDVWGETINVSAPIHPKRKDVMSECSKITGYEAAEFIKPKESPPAFKKINTDKLNDVLNYTFLYPNPLEFPYSKT
jgi:nucleoside-diphosphate-sugar epimerase